VRVGELRVALIAACAPLAQDFVVAGHDRDELGVLVFPNAEFARDPELESRLRERLSAFNAMAGGSSAVVRRALVMREPPSLDAGEITDKGYVNQRAVLARRTADVERLFGEDDRLVRLP
jgi:feruloyl-CoA synthase